MIYHTSSNSINFAKMELRNFSNKGFSTMLLVFFRPRFCPVRLYWAGDISKIRYLNMLIRQWFFVHFIKLHLFSRFLHVLVDLEGPGGFMDSCNDNICVICDASFLAHLTKLPRWDDREMMLNDTGHNYGYINYVIWKYLVL